jgi:hypothetical protein
VAARLQNVRLVLRLQNVPTVHGKNVAAVGCAYTPLDVVITAAISSTIANDGAVAIPILFIMVVVLLSPHSEFHQIQRCGR